MIAVERNLNLRQRGRRKTNLSFVPFVVVIYLKKRSLKVSKVNPNNPSAYKPTENYLRDWSDIDDGSYLETEAFARYALEIHGAIQYLGTPTQAQVKRWVIARIDKWFSDALELLQASGSIKAIQSGSLTRWIATEPPKPKEKIAWTGYNSPKPKPMPVPDGLQVFGDKSLY